MKPLIGITILSFISFNALAKVEIWKCYTSDTDRFLGYYKIDTYESPHIWKRKKGKWHPEIYKNIKLHYQPSQQNLSGFSEDGWIYVIDLLLKDIYFYEESGDTSSDYNSLYSCRIVKDTESSP